MTKLSSANTLASPTFTLPAAWQGAGWKIFSCACFAGINGIVRYWSGGSGETNIETLPVNVMMFFQNVFGTLFLLPWILKLGVHNLKTRHPGLHFMRVTTAVAGIYLLYLALQYMPIAKAIALSFTGPIFTIIGAWFILREKIGLQRFLAILLSLTGAFIISRPDIPLNGETQIIGLSLLFPLGSALTLAFSKLLTRKLARMGEKPTSLAAYLLILMAPISLLPALYEWVTPSLIHWPWLVLLGALATAAHLSFSKAYQLADVTFLTPFGFSKFFLSTLVGYIAFSELPLALSLWVGIACILGSIILIGYKMPLYSIASRFKSRVLRNNE
jgi:drug/metabolite transporter (DMT)-like permease